MLLVRRYTPMFRYCCTISVRTISGDPLTSIGVNKQRQDSLRQRRWRKVGNGVVVMVAKPTDQSCMASLGLTSSLIKRQLVQIYSVFPPLGPWRYDRANVLSIICRCPRIRVALLFTSCYLKDKVYPKVLLWHARQRYDRRTCTLLA